MRQPKEFESIFLKSRSKNPQEKKNMQTPFSWKFKRGKELDQVTLNLKSRKASKMKKISFVGQYNNENTQKNSMKIRTKELQINLSPMKTFTY